MQCLPHRMSVSFSIITVMKRLQAFKFQLRPDGQQVREMRRFAGACRFVFNRALALQNENPEAGNKYILCTRMSSWLIEWKGTGNAVAKGCALTPAFEGP